MQIEKEEHGARPPPTRKRPSRSTRGSWSGGLISSGPGCPGPARRRSIEPKQNRRGGLTSQHDRCQKKDQEPRESAVSRVSRILTAEALETGEARKSTIRCGPRRVALAVTGVTVLARETQLLGTGRCRPSTVLGRPWVDEASGSSRSRSKRLRPRGPPRRGDRFTKADQRQWVAAAWARRLRPPSQSTCHRDHT